MHSIIGKTVIFVITNIEINIHGSILGSLKHSLGITMSPCPDNIILHPLVILLSFC